MKRDIGHAVARAISFVCAEQNADGGFDAFVGSTRDLHDASRCETAFFTALALLALGSTTTFPAGSRRRALAFLLRWREPSGIVRYLSTPIAGDYDDICLVHWLLQIAGVNLDYVRIARRVARVRKSDGIFPTWIGSADVPGTIDPVVNVNIVRFLEWNGIDCAPTIACLQTLLRDWTPSRGTAYYESPAALPWCAATLPDALAWRIAGDATFLAAMECVRFEWISDAAFALLAIDRFGGAYSIAETLARTLLARQSKDGGWAAEGIFCGYGFWGSRALTTAIVAGALANHITRTKAEGYVSRRDFSGPGKSRVRKSGSRWLARI